MQLMRWIVAGPKMVRVIGEFEHQHFCGQRRWWNYRTYIGNSMQLMRWVVAGQEMVRVIGEFEESVESIKLQQSKGPDVKHREQVKSVQATFAKEV